VGAQLTIGLKVVQYVTLRLVRKDKKAGKTHNDAGDNGESGRYMGYTGKTVDSGSAEGAVDED
jgi:hypothetical protein